MKTRSALFSPEMVRAILANRKTKTRRVVKPQPEYKPEHGYQWYRRRKDMCWEQLTTAQLLAKCPQGQAGDRLRVKETWCADKAYDHLAPSKIPAVGQKRIWYMADGEKPEWAGRTRSSIHMPRWASRLLLELVSVSVERVQEISEADAIAEGFVFGADGNPGNGSCFDWFRSLWESIHGKGAWGRNEWVWVEGFRRIEA